MKTSGYVMVGWWTIGGLVVAYLVVFALRGTGALSGPAASLAQAGLIVVALAVGVTTSVRRSRRSRSEVAHPPSEDR